MKMQRILLVLAVLGLAAVMASPAFAVSKEIVQLQTQVQQLQDQIARMQQSFDQRMGVMQHLIEQTTDSMNKVNASVADVQRTMGQQQNDFGALSGQMQSLNDTLDELKTRLAKVGKQLDDMSSGGQNLTPGAVPPGQQAPPAEALYNNGLRDYNAGKLDLATQEFSDYMKFYGNTDLAGNAQYYLADIEFRQGNYQAAVRDYDKVLEQFPGGNKSPAAQLRKGMALVQLGQRDAAVKEFNSLIQRYPRSTEATTAREQLRKLGVTPGRSVTTRPRPQ